MMHIWGFSLLLFSFENGYFDLTEIILEKNYTNEISILKTRYCLFKSTLGPFYIDW